MARLDEARAYLKSLPDLWAKPSDAGRHAIAEAVFERIGVLGLARLDAAPGRRETSVQWVWSGREA